MTDRVVDGQGRVWVTTTRGAAELGNDITERLIRLWAHRYPDQLERHTTSDGTWYRLDQLAAVELATNERLTRTSTKRP